MSRGSRGGGRGRGRGGFGASNLPPMGLTFADIQNMSREAGELYPAMDPLPTLTAPTDEEKKVFELQDNLVNRLRVSPYYLVEIVKTDELPRYSDKYRLSLATQPTLKRRDLHAPFFPKEIFEDYFNQRRKRKGKTSKKKALNMDDMTVDDDAKGSSDKEGSDGEGDAGSHDEDYDVDEEYDNDYAENYFDNGEGDDMDDLGDGGGGGNGGGGGDYD